MTASGRRLLLRTALIAANSAYCCEQRLLLRRTLIAAENAYCCGVRLLLRRTLIASKSAYCFEERLLLRQRLLLRTALIAAKSAYCCGERLLLRQRLLLRRALIAAWCGGQSQALSIGSASFSHKTSSHAFVSLEPDSRSSADSRHCSYDPQGSREELNSPPTWKEREKWRHDFRAPNSIGHHERIIGCLAERHSGVSWW